MAKLVKTNPADLLNLQSGDYAHFVQDGIAINDVITFEPRHHVNNIHKTRNIRGIRIFLNILLSVIVFALALITGFYPISLLLFMAIFDLRSIKRINLPLNLSDFIPYDNIEEVKMIRGKLGFNYAHIIVKDGKENRSIRKLKLYDSQSGWDRAVVLFRRIGKLNLIEEVAKDFSGLKKITVGKGIEYAVEGDELFLIENGKYKEEREDPYKYFRFVAIIGVLASLGAAGSKVRMIIENHEYQFVDYLVVVFFIFLANIPFQFVRKTRPTVIHKSDVIGFKIKRKKFKITLKGWKVFSLVVKHDLKFFTPEDIKLLKEFSER